MPESEEKDHSETVAIAENVLCEAFAAMCGLKWKRNLIQIERQSFAAVS